ncbi:MAG: uroporphyrinogen decarboxylase family protein [Lachnospiraceae bacterium]|nr:uroporphyrinogen decarboxylase family protein [Lachnospiraceae bacterium]
MNSIERFYATIERRPVDRPACWMGDPTPGEAEKLVKFYGVKDVSELKKVCGDDFYAVEIPYHSETCNAIFAAFDWYMGGSDVDVEHRTLTARGCFADCEDVEDAEALNFPWPDPENYIDPELCRKLVDEAPDDKVVLGMLWGAHFQDTCAAFGMETALMNMIAEPELYHYVDDHVVDFYCRALRIFLEATKGKVHAILIGDDMGSQRALMISPAQVAEFVTPGAKKLIDIAHSYGVKVIYHSCGSIFEAIPSIIESGADAIHPIQAKAANMEPWRLKENFGDKVSFCGGVDTQELLPHGTPEDVRDKVRELRDIFPTGLIISPSHEALQIDVPAENVKALFDAVAELN